MLSIALVYSGAHASNVENQDTVIQRDEVAQALTQLGCRVECFALGNSLDELEHWLAKFDFDLVFNLVETFKDSDRNSYVLPALFQAHKLPYTGCSALSLAMTGSKLVQKKLLTMAGIPTAEYFLHTDTMAASTTQWIVKSDTEHASIGLDASSVVDSIEQAIDKIKAMHGTLGGLWFAERYIEGREFNIALLPSAEGECDILPIAEMTFVGFADDQPKIVDFAAKWDSGSTVYHTTVRRFLCAQEEERLNETLKTIALQCWQLFSSTGPARVDIRVDELGNPWVLEVNANPCLSADAGFMVAAQRAGLTHNAVIDRMIQRINLN